jgi:hypothetical protein
MESKKSHDIPFAKWKDKEAGITWISPSPKALEQKKPIVGSGLKPMRTGHKQGKMQSLALRVGLDRHSPWP